MTRKITDKQWKKGETQRIKPQMQIGQKRKGVRTMKPAPDRNEKNRVASGRREKKG